MSTTTQEAPPAPEQKSSNFVALEPFNEEGQVILTVVKQQYIPAHQNVKEDGSVEVFPAVEFYLGTITADGPRFIKTWPARYSIHEKANYAKMYKFVTGHLPIAGSTPKDILGGGVTATIVNKEKESKKSHKRYTASSAKDLGPVFPKLKGEIVPLAKLLPVLEKLIEDSKQPRDGNASPATADKDGAPF